MRDDFTQETIRTIASRVGYRCSHPECEAQTVGPCTDLTKHFNVGVAAHIVAASPGGPRYDKSLTSEQRKHPENGIWLCQNHAKEIDNDVIRYPADLLRAWKRDAEARAMSRLAKAPGSPEGVAVSPGERYGHQMMAELEDGRVLPWASIFDPTAHGPAYYSCPSFVIRFMVAKMEAVSVFLIWELRATVYDFDPTTKFRPRMYAYPVSVNAYIVTLEPPVGGRPRPCIAESHHRIDRDDPTKYAPIAIDGDIPEVIDVRFNATEPGVYRVALDVVIAVGVNRYTHRILDTSEVLFTADEEEDDSR